MELEQIKGIIKTLEQADYEKVAFSKVYQVVGQELQTLPVSVATLKAGTLILRGRISKSAELFNSEREISYRTDWENIYSYGRCNIPRQSMFYGAFEGVDTPKDRMALFTVLLEIHPEFRRRTGRPLKASNEYFTVGRWVVKEDIELPHFIFDKGVYEKHPHMKTVANTLLGQMKNERPNDWETNQALVEMFSKALTKRNDSSHENYKLTAALTQVLQERGYPGLIYQSVQTEYEGFNIVLNPFAVEGLLELVAVDRFKVYLEGMKHNLVHDFASRDFGPLNSKFEWQSASESPDEINKKINAK